MNTYQTGRRTSQQDEYALQKDECCIIPGYMKS